MTTLSDEQIDECHAVAFRDTHTGAEPAETERMRYGRLVASAQRAAIGGHDFRTLLEEAVDDIEDLASYAPKYFREKLNIEGTLAKYRAALSGAGESK